MLSHSSLEIFHSCAGEIYPLERKVIKLVVDYATAIVFWPKFFGTSKFHEDSWSVIERGYLLIMN